MTTDDIGAQLTPRARGDRMGPGTCRFYVPKWACHAFPIIARRWVTISSTARSSIVAQAWRGTRHTFACSEIQVMISSSTAGTGRAVFTTRSGAGIR